MTAKKTASNKAPTETKPEVQLDIGNQLQIEIDRLTSKDKDSLKIIEQQEIDLKLLDEEITALKEEVSILNGRGTESASKLRTTMLMAMLPQVRVAYAKTDAQNAEKAVDEIIKVWGLE